MIALLCSTFLTSMSYAVDLSESQTEEAAESEEDEAIRLCSAGCDFDTLKNLRAFNKNEQSTNFNFDATNDKTIYYVDRTKTGDSTLYRVTSHSNPGQEDNKTQIITVREGKVVNKEQVTQAGANPNAGAGAGAGTGAEEEARKKSLDDFLAKTNKTSALIYTDLPPALQEQVALAMPKGADLTDYVYTLKRDINGNYELTESQTNTAILIPKETNKPEIVAKGAISEEDKKRIAEDKRLREQRDRDIAEIKKHQEKQKALAMKELEAIGERRPHNLNTFTLSELTPDLKNNLGTFANNSNTFEFETNQAGVIVTVRDSKKKLLATIEETNDLLKRQAEWLINEKKAPRKRANVPQMSPDPTPSYKDLATPYPTSTMADKPTPPAPTPPKAKAEAPHKHKHVHLPTAKRATTPHTVAPKAGISAPMLSKPTKMIDTEENTVISSVGSANAALSE